MGQTHPLAFGPQFSVHRGAGDRILLLSERRSFCLKGALYHELLPLLDGTRTEARIVEALADRAEPEEIARALAHLQRRGYVCKRQLTGAEQQALWLEWEREPEQVAAALAAWPLAVAGLGRRARASGGTAVEKLVISLEDAGFPLVAENEARLVLALVDDFLTCGLERVAEAHQRAGRSLILFKPGGREAWLSPRFDPDRRRCLTCLGRWIAEFRPGDELVTVGDGQPLRPARGMLRATLEFARAHTVLALVRMAMGDPELDEHLLAFDSLTGSQSRHFMRLDPGCPTCGRRGGAEEEERQAELRRPTLASLAESGEVRHSDGGWRVLSTQEAHDRLQRLVSPITGIVPGLEDHSARLGLPVVAALQNQPKVVGMTQNRQVGRPGGAAGKGATLLQAQVSCMAEALERYCAGFSGREPRRRARLDEIGEAAVDPRDLLLFSERQYAQRERWNRGATGFNLVPERFDPAEAIEWSPIYRLRDGAARWVPSRYCYFNYVDVAEDGGRAFCYADSNGCASGGALGEAALQALLELIERDHFALFWYNRACRPALDLDLFDDGFVQATRARYRASGRTLHALDLRADLGIPVIAAVSGDGAGGRIQIGLGAHTEVAIALSRAVSELNQMTALYGPETEARAPNDETVRWLRRATFETDPYLLPLEGPGSGPAAFARLCEPGIGPALEACAQALERAGLEPLAMDLSWPGLDFACVRVVVPGLRHFWARFAPGRLYQVPVALGWRDRPTAEADLNPTAFFL